MKQDSLISGSFLSFPGDFPKDRESLLGQEGTSFTLLFSSNVYGGVKHRD